MLSVWKTWDFAQTFAFHDCAIFSLISWGSEAYYCALCVYVDEICLCLPYTFELASCVLSSLADGGGLKNDEFQQV